MTAQTADLLDMLMLKEQRKQAIIERENLCSVDLGQLSMNRDEYAALAVLWLECAGYKVEYIGYKRKWFVTWPDNMQAEIDYWWLVDIAKQIEKQYNAL